jgi:hypothetical protein
MNPSRRASGCSPLIDNAGARLRWFLVAGTLRALQREQI